MFVSTFSDSSTRGHTQKTLAPVEICVCRRATNSFIRIIGSFVVLIGLRPAGFSLIIETSMSPQIVIDKVRGIGVADNANRSGLFPFCRRDSRWATPNRCCSSIMTNPKSRYSTSAENSACVPTTRRVRPDFNDINFFIV